MAEKRHEFQAAGAKRGNGTFERPQERPAVILRRLWVYLARYRWLLLLAAALSLAANLLELFGPRLSGTAIDAIRPGKGGVDFAAVFLIARRMLVFYAVSALLSYLLSVIMVRLSRHVVAAMRRDLYARLMELPVPFYDTHAAGDLLSVLSYDADTVGESLSSDLVQLMTSAITVAGSFVMMLTISPRLVLVFAVTIPVTVWFTRYRSEHVRPMYRERSARLGDLNGYAEEMTGGLGTIRAYGREKVFSGRFGEKNRAACEAYYRADCFASMSGPSVSLINNLTLAFVSLWGSFLYMAGSVTLGGVSSFVLYSRKFSGPINEFANILSDLQSALAAAERVFRLLDEPAEAPDAPGAGELTDVRGRIDLENVTFGYSPERTILRDFSLHAEPGQVVALVGPTGAGKTTVINLLMRFYEPQSGRILVDGQDTRKLTRGSLRRAYSMVLQDTWLFTGTEYENLAYGKAGVTREQVRAAAAAAHIDGFIESLPQGYDTVLTDGGSSISKGQKQLLTIARAMVIDAPMLILDEATSNVDTRTEQQIQSAMLQLMKGHTCLVIAHRLSTVRHADCIAVLKDGAVAEQGTHAELMRKGGYYRELYSAQFDPG